jgi:DNA-binding CsgD family transcriptional regulator
MHGIGGAKVHADQPAAAHLAEALGTTLDSLAVAIVIVAERGQILHANQAAEHMLVAKSPVLSHGGCLAALNPEATRELRRAIAAVHAEPQLGTAGVGVPLVEKDLSAATAHVLPLGRQNAATGGLSAVAAVFVAHTQITAPADIGIVARIFGFTPAETRLLRELMAGASLSEAAGSLGITEATAKTHRNHIFMKAGVSRRTDLLTLIGRLLPPIRRTQNV